MIRIFAFCLLILSIHTHFLLSQSPASPRKYSDTQIKKMIEQYKSEIRGPYRDLRWFCKDGTTVAPQERCAEPGGVQRARYKDEVIKLGELNHVFFGQILATTQNIDFWDQDYNQSRLKQYQLEQFLRANDNGWINNRAQFYRGAYQIEDEEAWGIQFYSWLLESRNRLSDYFFLIRQSTKDIPHAAQTNVALNVRATSKEISDLYPRFMNLRVKIHGQPEASDIESVVSFRESNKDKYSSKIDSMFSRLLADMRLLYKPVDINDFKTNLKKLPTGSPMAVAMADFIKQYAAIDEKDAKAKSMLLAEVALVIRQETTKSMKSLTRLSMLDASTKMEGMLVQEASAWHPKTIREHLIKIKTLETAAIGFGYVQEWEIASLPTLYALNDSTMVSVKELGEILETLRRPVEWGIATIRANYEDVVKLYIGFEPLSSGFIDDKVRSTILLQMGAAVSELGDYYSKQAGFSNTIMSIARASAARGLNPGYAIGELVVTDQSPDEIEVSANKIYVFDRPPSDLKPVAGIATVSEGNMVSHVQLLARNLGIPNAVISKENLNDLMAYNGTIVFYAVSNKGTIIIKSADEMSDSEKSLFVVKTRNEDKITVPVENMDLTSNSILNLRAVDASSSGKICGPKAANLGQLKHMFPENVVEGLVIPFSIFKKHFDQPMDSGTEKTYWKYLNETFDEARNRVNDDQADSTIEKFILHRLDTLQKAIKNISLNESFVTELKAMFQEVLGKALGQVPVFIRSDTNMEDLKDFTGAGLNLTLFNVLSEKQILQGIKDVWASPYSERSYKWRQKYLLNPENVFPSILIIPSVNAEASGVLITKGLNTGEDHHNTVAFNRGVGGAVEGQASETWLLRDENFELIAPAREPKYTSIPATGGTKQVFTTFTEAILTVDRLNELKSISNELRIKLPSTGMHSPYDVELGFIENKIWLFQVRPFVENKRALASDYLQSISPNIPDDIFLELDKIIEQ